MSTQFDESSVRRDPSGQFTNKPASESAASLDDASTPDPELEAMADAQSMQMDEIWTRKDALDRQLAQASLVAGCARIRSRFPEAATVTVTDSFDGGTEWAAHDAAGDEIDLFDDDELNEDLYGYGGYLDMNRPSTMRELARGHDPADPRSGQIKVDKHTGSVDEIVVDVDEMLARGRT